VVTAATAVARALIPKRLSNAIVGVCALIALTMLGAWVATGAPLRTSWGPRMIVADGPSGRLIIPGGPTGDEIAESPQIGLLPSGPGKSAIALTTIAGPALLAALGAWLLRSSRPANGPPAPDTPAPGRAPGTRPH
jgi:hypothetical protein